MPLQQRPQFGHRPDEQFDPVRSVQLVGVSVLVAQRNRLAEAFDLPHLSLVAHGDLRVGPPDVCRLYQRRQALIEEPSAVVRLSQLDRAVVEEFLVWNRTGPSRGRRGRGQPVSTVRAHRGIATLKTFFEDLALWGWAERPPRMLVHRSDLPRLPEAVPRALPPDVHRDLMAAVDHLDDIAARCGIRILRGTGMQLGELLDLELDCLLDFAGHGSWVRVPLGKLATERTVPADDDTLAASDAWIARRGRQRALPNPRTGQPAGFLFVIGGRAWARPESGGAWTRRPGWPG